MNFFSTVLILLFSSTFTQGTILCHQCGTGVGITNCLRDADFLLPCPNGTTMCYIRWVTKSLYIRGCLHEDAWEWKECQIERSNDCFVCYGTGCNHIDILSKKRSLQYCMRCKNNRECQLKMDPEQCDGHDSIFGPMGCFTQYAKDGKSIVRKACLNEVYKLIGGFDQGIVRCTGHACNYIKKEFQMRCLTYYGPHDLLHVKGKINDCFDEKPSQSVMAGCYFKSVREGVNYGCNTLRLPIELHRCTSAKNCQTCHENMCNNRTVEYINTCMKNPWMYEKCLELESMCFVLQKEAHYMDWGCLSAETPGLYHPDTLTCSNEKMGRLNCAPTDNIMKYRGCFECSGPLCDNVLSSLSYTAKTICPLGVTQCYSALRLDGRIFRGCYTNTTSEGVKICKGAIAACKICNHNYCNYDPLVPAKGQCYKTNWIKNDQHETSLRFADCQGEYFYGTTDNCYIAASSRLLMRMGCISEMRAGVDSSYAITTGSTQVAWLYQNSCYKCVSNPEGYCWDVARLEQHVCVGLHRYPVRGCYTLIDKRNKHLERGCITEVNEYLLRLCDMPVFVDKCYICQDNGCNNEYLPFED